MGTIIYFEALLLDGRSPGCGFGRCLFVRGHSRDFGLAVLTFFALASFSVLTVFTFAFRLSFIDLGCVALGRHSSCRVWLGLRFSPSLLQ